MSSKETGYHVKRSSPASLLPEEMQHELMLLLQREFMPEAVLINASTLLIIRHISISDQFSLVLMVINRLVYLGNDTHIKNALHEMKT